MRILLVHFGSYLVAHSGASKANRYMIELLARRGHECLCVVPPMAHGELGEQLLLEDELRRIQVPFLLDGTNIVFHLNGVQVRAVGEISQANVRRLVGIRREIDSACASFAPDYVLVSSADRAFLLLRTALKNCGAKTVYLARATADLGFGPMTFIHNPDSLELLHQVGKIISNSFYMKSYLQQWGQLHSEVLDLPMYDCRTRLPDGPTKDEFVTIINPCGIKGISIFISLAERFASVRFAAVPTWGMTESDRVKLLSLNNVSLLPASDEIASVFERTRVLLVPSLWDEAFGRVVIEAMIHRIPVLASNVGGLSEAKLGVPFLLPVRPIERYLPQLDDRRVPVPVVPEQNLIPWEVALADVLDSRDGYERLAEASQNAALRYVGTLREEDLERVLGMVRSVTSGGCKPSLRQQQQPLRSTN